MLSIILLKLERFYRENEVSSVTRTARTIRADQLKLISEQRIFSAAHPFAHARDSTSNEGKHAHRMRGVPDPGADRLLLFGGIASVAAVPSNAAHVLVRLLRGREVPDVNVNYEFGQQALAAQVPDNFYARKRAYLLLQRHGEATCTRDQPKCKDCPVHLNCLYFIERSASAKRDFLP
jgi:adenine-specific DNA glycosylase